MKGDSPDKRGRGVAKLLNIRVGVELNAESEVCFACLPPKVDCNLSSSKRLVQKSAKLKSDDRQVQPRGQLGW